MKVIYGIGKVKPALESTVAAIGIFDGVHKGHQWLIRQVVACARRQRSKSLVVTFHPHPVQVLHKRELSYLASLEHRLKLIEALGVDVTVVVRFTKSFAHLQPEQFIKNYLVGRLNVSQVFVGDDFRFGENRIGDVDLFTFMGKKYGFKVNHMPPIKKTSMKISSTRLRELIGSGQLKEAASMLGRNVSVLAEVVHGEGRGKKLGYPTANLKFDSVVLPPHGVYIVGVNLNGRPHRGIANVGYRPSFDNKNSQVHLEVHILDFKRNIYGCQMVVEFLHKIRDEKKFPSMDQLAHQIQSDEHSARRYFQTRVV